MKMMAMGALQERANQLKEKRPRYGPVLDFFVQVRVAQDASRASIRVDQVKANVDGNDLIAKENFPVDIDASIDLFNTLCRLSKAANPNLSAEIAAIDLALADTTVDLKRLVAVGGNDEAIEHAAAGAGLDQKVLSFLVKNSSLPSIEAVREQLRDEVGLESSRKDHCPVCGSPPALSLLKGEGGMRYSLCSFCGCEWRIDRLSCSVCGNKEQGSLQYFCGEGEEAHRIDLCDACHHYIKTIDIRSLEGADPELEDLGTMHLDVVAVQKGYARAVPGFWTA